MCFTIWKCILDSKRDMKSLIPKGAKSMFDQNRVTNITTLFSLPPTFRMHL